MSREELIQECINIAELDCYTKEQFLLRRLMYAVAAELKKAEDEKALERPHGEWIIRRDKRGTHIYSVCSTCNVAYLDTDFPNFCKQCGADMRKKEGDGE